MLLANNTAKCPRLYAVPRVENILTARRWRWQAASPGPRRAGRPRRSAPGRTECASTSWSTSSTACRRLHAGPRPARRGARPSTLAGCSASGHARRALHDDATHTPSVAVPHDGILEPHPILPLVLGALSPHFLRFQSQSPSSTLRSRGSPPVTLTLRGVEDPGQRGTC